MIRSVATMAAGRQRCTSSRCFLISLFAGAALTALRTRPTITHFGPIKESVTAAVDHFSLGRPLCTNGIFRAYYRTRHGFPPPGQWTVRDPIVSAVYPVLSPDICSFPLEFTGGDFVKQCFQRKRLRSILIMGDSQGAHYSWGLRDILNQTFDDCEVMKFENRTDGVKKSDNVDKRYFSDGNTSLESRMMIGVRWCGCCLSYKMRCQDRDIEPFTFEYIGFHHMERFVMDVNMGNMASGETNLISFHEFLFRHYLKDNTPDLIIFSPTVNHGKFRELPRQFRLQLRSLKSYIDAWTPAETEVYWLPGMAEHENRRTRQKYINKTKRGKLATELILDLNNLVYKELEPDLLLENGRHFGFLDLFQASVNRSEWSYDGIHMEPFWYDLIMSYLLQVFCVS